MPLSYRWPTPVDEGHLVVKPGDRFLRDVKGRAWLLRGVNMSGNCKIPKYPVSVGSHVGGRAYLNHDDSDGDNHGKEGGKGQEQEEHDISFVGRPFELGDADEHLSRLRHWGFRMLRWVVTWEAVEHKGPGQYDEEYLDYTVKALDKAREYGFKVMIDFHQDVWSRFTGGSGAPLWTLYAAGLDPAHFHTTGAALVHNLWPDDRPFPRMGWLTNYYKLACTTMFTLFYAGSVLAPRCTLEGGVNIQEYLQRHFINAMVALAQRIHTYEGGKLEDTIVVGWDSWNEPSNGWIGLQRLDTLPKEHDARVGDMPTPFQTLLLGQGIAVERCQTYAMKSLGPAEAGTRKIDPKGVKAWLTLEKREAMDRKYGIRRDASFPRAHECIWAQHGVWATADKKILQQDYFAVGPASSSTGKRLNWVEDHWTAFAHRVTETIRKVHPSAILFLEPPVYTPPPDLRAILENATLGVSGNSDGTSAATSQAKCLLDNMVYTPHHYDDLALVIRRYLDWINVDLLGLSRKRCTSLLDAAVIGRQRTRELFGQQIGYMVQESDANLGVRPVLIGETGAPMDLELELPSSTKPSLWKRILPFASSDGAGAATIGNCGYLQQGSSKLFEQCFDNILTGLDRNLVHYTLWNYTPENTAQHSDHWNNENLSLYSKEQQLVEDEDERADRNCKRHPLDRGARALDVFCRPYPMVTVGTPVHLEFDRHRKVFQVWISTTLDAGIPLTRSATSFANVKLRTKDAGSSEGFSSAPEISKAEHEFRQANKVQLATEIYIPEYHFGGHGYKDGDSVVVRASEGEWYWDRAQQLLYWYYDQSKASRVVSLFIAAA